MESSLCQSLCYSLPSSSSSIRRQILPRGWHSTPPISATLRRGLPNRRGMVVGCANLGPVAAKVEREFEDSVSADEEAEWMKAGRLSEKCGGGGRGMVEILECLEREAIMGEDQGREPNDYNRRAQIFDRSSRVFQALKERAAGAAADDDRHGS